MRTGYLSTDRFYFARAVEALASPMRRIHGRSFKSDDENTASADT
jgi:hypothetical protein